MVWGESRRHWRFVHYDECSGSVGETRSGERLMSWYHDYLLRDAIASADVSLSGGGDRRLITFRMGHKLDSAEPHRVPFVFIPAQNDSPWATTCTYERDGIIQLYVQHTANSTAWTAGDMLFIASFDVTYGPHKGYPPVLPFHVRYALDPSLPQTDFMMAHIITKEGWRINGVSYPSAHVCMRIS